jgi:hypothetical protein
VTVVLLKVIVWSLTQALLVSLTQSYSTLMPLPTILNVSLQWLLKPMQVLLRETRQHAGLTACGS